MTLPTFLSAIAATSPGGEPPPPWFFPVFPFLFAGLWIGVSILLAFASGHMELLRRFPPVDERREESFTFASGRMRGVNYGSALHVGIGARGLHLAANGLFRPIFWRGIPCIPWREIRVVGSQTGGIIDRFRGSRFVIRSLDLRFTLRGGAGRAVEGKLASLGLVPRGSGALVREG